MRQIDKRNFPIRKRILTECIVSLILGALLLTGCEKKQEEATSGRKSELLIVENSDGEQSQGFVLEDDGDIIVPADFVGDDKEVKLTLPDGTKTTATVWSRNPESNVAVLSVSNPSALTSSGVQPVTVSQTQASVNSSEYVYILHTVNGQEVKSQARVVERGQKNGTEYILADMNSSPDGLTGCPVYSAAGSFVGTVAYVDSGASRVVIMPASSLSQEVSHQKSEPQTVKSTEQSSGNVYSRIITEEPETTKVIRSTTAAAVQASDREKAPQTNAAQMETAQSHEDTTQSSKQDVTGEEDKKPEAIHVSPADPPGNAEDYPSEEETDPQAIHVSPADPPKNPEDHPSEETTDPAKTDTVEIKTIEDNSAYIPQASEVMARTLAVNRSSSRKIDAMENAPYSVAIMDLNGDQLPEMVYYENTDTDNSPDIVPADTEERVSDYEVERRVVTYNTANGDLEEIPYQRMSFRTAQTLPADNSAIVTLPQDPGSFYDVKDIAEGYEYEITKVTPEEEAEDVTGIVSKEAEGFEAQSDGPAEVEEQMIMAAQAADPAEAISDPETDRMPGDIVVYYTNRKDDPEQAEGVTNAGMTYDDAMEYFESILGYSVDEEVNGQEPEDPETLREDPMILEFLTALGQDNGLDLLMDGYDSQDPESQQRLLSALVGQRGADVSGQILPAGRQLEYAQMTPVVILSSEENVSWAAQNVFQIALEAYEQFRTHASVYGYRISPVCYEGVNGYADGCYYSGSFHKERLGEQITIQDIQLQDSLYIITFEYSSSRHQGIYTAELEIREEEGNRYCSLYRVYSSQ